MTADLALGCDDVTGLGVGVTIAPGATWFGIHPDAPDNVRRVRAARAVSRGSGS